MPKTILLAFMLIFLPTAVWAEDVVVRYVIDGDTIILSDNRRIQLLGVNAPEIGRDGRKTEPYAKLAQQRLRTLLPENSAAILKHVQTADRYGRIHAIVAQAGNNLNVILLTEGLAQFDSRQITPATAPLLMAAERAAIKNQVGLWQRPELAVKQADENFAPSELGRYRLVSGTVKEVAPIGDSLFLNFGDDWRTDFSVELSADLLSTLQAVSIDPYSDYENKQILVRGIVQPVNGALIAPRDIYSIEIIH